MLDFFDTFKSMLLLKGAEVSQKIQNEIKSALAIRSEQGRRAPHLSVILVGHDPASQIYVSLKEKMCKKLGIQSSIHRLDSNIEFSELKKIITNLNQDPNIDAILVQLPLPKHLNARDVLECIDPRKDVDCLTEKNLGRIISGQADLYPCTPAGIIEMLKHYQISLSGKNVAVIGRSLIVGTPLFHMLNKENATVTLFHSKSQNVKAQLKNFDLVCVAIGKPNQFKYSDFKKDAFVIDVGINRLDTGLVGDVLNDQCEDLAGASPVPGGVGLMTIAMLMKNTLTLAQNSK